MILLNEKNSIEKMDKKIILNHELLICSVTKGKLDLPKLKAELLPRTEYGRLTNWDKEQQSKAQDSDGKYRQIALDCFDT